MDKTELPEDLDRAFTALCKAFAELWPHMTQRIKDEAPQEHADMEQYLKMGGVMRAVFHIEPGPALAFELIDHEGKPREFYRLYGTKRGGAAGRGLQ